MNASVLGLYKTEHRFQIDLPKMSKVSQDRTRLPVATSLIGVLAFPLSQAEGGLDFPSNTE